MDRVIIIGLSAVLCSVVNTQPAINPRAKLTKYLFKEYDSGVIPNAKANDTLIVFYHFILGRVDNLDEKNQIMTTYGWILLNWQDPFLAWEPDDFEGVETIVIPGKRVWIPEIVLQNGVEDGVDPSLESDFRVQIDSRGFVMWIPSFRWSTTCNVDLTLFPLDTQLCNVTFMAWLNSMDGSMFFRNLEHNSLETEGLNDTKITVMTGLLTENEQWSLVDSNIFDFNGILDTGNQQETRIASLSFALLLRRQPTYYVVHILIPCLTISMVSMFMFCLPVESGEKVSFGITVLLSYTLLLLMINDITPKGGPKVPLLTYYIIFSMMLSALALICTFFILRVHNHSTGSRAPIWARRLFFCNCAQVVEIAPQGSEKDVKKLTDDETATKKEWEYLARKLDKVAFVAFMSLYVATSTIIAIHIITCANGSKICGYMLTKL